jgi:hypothetical protein
LDKKAAKQQTGFLVQGTFCCFQIRKQFLKTGIKQILNIQFACLKHVLTSCRSTDSLKIVKLHQEPQG